MAVFVAQLSILPYCYYASRIVLKIQHTADAAFETRWYELPVELQMNVKHIIAFAQLKRSVSGWLFKCDLGGFMKVREPNIHGHFIYNNFNRTFISLQIVKTAMSYFVMFRSFSE